MFANLLILYFRYMLGVFLSVVRIFKGPNNVFIQVEKFVASGRMFRQCVGSTLRVSFRNLSPPGYVSLEPQWGPSEAEREVSAGERWRNAPRHVRE